MHKLEMTRFTDSAVVHTEDITGMIVSKVNALKEKLYLRFRPDYYYAQPVKVVRFK